MSAPELGIVEALRVLVTELARIERGEHQPADIPRACMFMRRDAERILAAWDAAQALRAQPAPEPESRLDAAHRAGMRVSDQCTHTDSGGTDICEPCCLEAIDAAIEFLCPSDAPTQAPGAAPEKQR